MDKITKKEAKSLGLKFYYTGKPCKHGHLVERLVKGGMCKECRDIANSHYREEDREKYNEYCRTKKKLSYSTEKRRISYAKYINQEMFQAAKTRAKNKNIPFTITLEDVIIPESCPVFNVKLDSSDIQRAPTLDRINNDLGYIKGNVQVISSRANRLKNNGSIDEFEMILAYMKSKNG
jgi:hypothetical protein